MQGRTYLCKEMDLASKVAVVRPVDVKYYTKTRDFVDINIIGGNAAYAPDPVVCSYTLNPRTVKLFRSRIFLLMQKN